MPDTIEDKPTLVDETPESPSAEEERKPEPRKGEDITRFYLPFADTGESLYFQLYPYGLLY